MNTPGASPMSQDIVARLRAWSDEKYPVRGHLTGELLREAASEIERLRAIVARQGEAP